MSLLSETFVLLVVFQFKHFIADYLLQNQYMLGKFKKKNWALPLSAHCLVHLFFTLVIGLLYLELKNPNHGLVLYLDLGVELTTVSVYLQQFIFGLIDFTIHFIMDKIKASPDMLGRYTPLSKREYWEMMNHKPTGSYMVELHEVRSAMKIKSNRNFWWSLGLDQMVHHLTDILIVCLMVGGLNV